MEWSYPWLSIDEDREYDDGDFARFYGNLFTNGVSLTTADSLKVSANPTGGMRIQIGTGAAFFEGRSYFNSSPLALSVQVASSSQDRTDSVVIHMDKGLREIKLLVKAGNTQVVRTTDIFELQLATIRVPRNSSTISADLITDKRPDEKVCGYCTPYQKISVSGLEEQYRAMLQMIIDEMNKYADEESAAFETKLKEIIDKGMTQIENQQAQWQDFITTVTDELTENQAVNLQSQILKLRPDKKVFEINHNLGAYPDVFIVGWENGFGINALGEADWLGTIPETLPVKVGYPSSTKLEIAVPFNWEMMKPTITQENKFNFLLVEGKKSLRIIIRGRNNGII